MEEIRGKLNNLIIEKGLLNEITILVSQQLDKLIVSHYKNKQKKSVPHKILVEE